MSRNIHVLYIDDDPANLQTVSRALNRQGYIMLTAKNGQEGIRIAEKERPDFILLDILLPDMNGFEVCEQLRSMPRLKRIPILGISASAMDGDRRRSLSSGFDGFLSKPIARLELVNTIERLTRV